MKIWAYAGTGLVALLSIAPRVSAQLPVGAPAAPAAPAASAAAAPAAAGAGDGTKGFAFIRKCQEQKDICKRKICESQLGQLINNSIMPMSALTGGIIPPCCPTTPSQDELQKLADDPGPMGAAATIAVDEANAKKRRAAIRYLGTADCHWWPEAEKGLIVALRTDRNECVRLEAAEALGNGCCCTRRVIEALAIVVEGSSKDGNPSENSERVRAAALGALQHCLSCYKDVQPVEKSTEGIKEGPVGALVPRPVMPPEEDKSKIKLSAHYTEVEKKPMPQVVANARKVAENAHSQGYALPTGEHTLFNVLFHGSNASVSGVEISEQENPGFASGLLPKVVNNARMAGTGEIVTFASESGHAFEPPMIAAPTSTGSTFHSTNTNISMGAPQAQPMSAPNVIVFSKEANMPPALANPTQGQPNSKPVWQESNPR